MRDDKLTAIVVACGGGLLVSWQSLEHYANDGLTFKEWLVGILAGVVVGGAAGRLGYVLVRRFNPGPGDDE